MPRRALPAAVFLLLLLPAASRRAVAAPDEADVYVREATTIERTIGILEAEARRSNAPAVVVVLDKTTFSPPPGRNEFRFDHDYPGDAERWLDALEVWSQRTPVPLSAVVTTSEAAVRVGRAGWRVDLLAQLGKDVWDEDERLEPALTWVRRWMPRGRGRARPALLVLIASEMTPERFADGHEPWRRRLLDVGTYWDEEAIGSALAGAACRLWVVAPEVRFGDELPFATLPQLPWASKPQRPPPDLYGSWGADEDEAWDNMLRDDLERDLADEYPDPEERKRVIDEILGREDGEGTREAGPSPEDRREKVPSARGGRFSSGTPALFPHWGGRVLFGNDVPSGYGYWPYARAVAKSGGRYLFYPYPASGWLDVCPRDGAALRRLAPPLVSAAAFPGRFVGDRALDALCRATDEVLARTPWATDGRGREGGWSAFASAAPPRLVPGYRTRRVPADLFLVGSAAELRAVGQELARALPRYDRAIAILDEALEKVKERGDAGPSPRSVADLRLGRFWFSMSALHLHALSLCLAEMDRYVPAGWDERRDRFAVSHLPLIRMSDCVDAYDGRTLPPAAETHYPRALHRAWSFPGREDGPARWEPGQIVPGQQGNLLAIPPESADFRAKRDVGAVLAHLDARLRERALDVIASARSVMEHHARTPWGWSVYYAEVLGWIFDPVDGGVDVRPRPGEDEPPDTPWSPTRPPGSSPGGPTTPR